MLGKKRGDGMENPLYELFKTCLNRSYRETENGASWAYDRRGDALFLWFEHSRGIEDWVHNLYFAAVPYREMVPEWHCHAGFLKVWKALIPFLKPLILDGTVRRICTVGYSHGAALAVLCREYIWYHRPDLRETVCGYAYGCPRVLYGCVPPEIAIRWSSFWRISTPNDIVTRLPPRTLGYCHVGNFIRVGDAGTYSAIDAHRPETYLLELSGKNKNAQNPHVND